MRVTNLHERFKESCLDKPRNVLAWHLLEANNEKIKIAVVSYHLCQIFVRELHRIYIIYIYIRLPCRRQNKKTLIN